jgi:hypothetical protein
LQDAQKASAARRTTRNEAYEPFQQPDKEEISQLIWKSLAGIVDQ